MKRVSLVLVTMLFSGISMVHSPPASAHLSVCAGTGEMTTNPLSYADAITGSPGAFSLVIGGGYGVGRCIPATGNGSMTLVGSLSGGCLNWTGAAQLTDADGTHGVTVYEVGSLVLIVGTDSSVGLGNAVPLPMPGNSCLDDTATKFQVTLVILNA